MEISYNGKSYNIDELPNECPFCHKKIHPIQRGIIERTIYACVGDICPVDYLDVILSCSDEYCQYTFIAYYYEINVRDYEFCKTSIGIMKSKHFSENIKKISEFFEKIYNEAYHAEQYGLMKICGAGYRKALEFLIKDYAKYKNPEKANVIEGCKFTLDNCINTYVKDEKIKNTAKRAKIIGNEETHYNDIREWEGTDIKDLVNLIELTVYWIEKEMETEKTETIYHLSNNPKTK